MRLMRRSSYPGGHPNRHLRNRLQAGGSVLDGAICAARRNRGEGGSARRRHHALSLNGREAQSLKVELVDVLLADSGAKGSPLTEMVLKSFKTEETKLPNK